MGLKCHLTVVSHLIILTNIMAKIIIKNEQLSLFDGDGEISSNPEPPNSSGSKGRWQSLKEKNFGMEYCAHAIFSGKYGFPLIRSYQGELPEHYVSIGDIKKSIPGKCCATGFEYDVYLEELWYNFDTIKPYFQNYMCIGQPDYSLYLNTPAALQISNTWRSHVMAYAIQESGTPVLPAPSWSNTTSYDYCFDGYEKGGAVLISTIGTLRNELSRFFFKSGFFEMLKRLDPDMVILYGDVSDEMRSWLPKELPIQYVQHYRFERARNYGR
jgi:hypothetical protein